MLQKKIAKRWHATAAVSCASQATHPAGLCGDAASAMSNGRACPAAIDPCAEAARLFIKNGQKKFLHPLPAPMVRWRMELGGYADSLACGAIRRVRGCYRQAQYYNLFSYMMLNQMLIFLLQIEI